MQSEESNQSRPKSIEAEEFQAPGSSPAVGVPSTQGNGFGRGQISNASDAPWWHSQFNLMLCVFALLAIAALLFVSLTPAPTLTKPSTIIDAQGNSTQGDSSVAGSSQEPVAPYSESEREQARADSQDVLSELLETKKALEEKDVKSWAADAYDAALSLAEQGDVAYQQQEYASAIELYKRSVSDLESIYDLIPNELNRRVADGLVAIQQGKSELAKSLFQSALSLDQNHVPALQGMQRVKTLGEVLALVAAAAVDEQSFTNSDDLSDIQQAKQKYQQALDLDGAASSAKSGLARSGELETDKHYRLAMSAGFNALFARRYSQARAQFNSALQHKPADPTARTALRQALASDQRTSIRSLLSQAKTFEKSEQWGSALSNYQTVLQRDPNQVSAKVGRIRSQARVELNQQINDVLSDPLALSKTTARDHALKVLGDAKGISKKGTVLNDQIASLEGALKQIDSTVKVTIASDSLTQVSLKKAGAKRISLGKFTAKNLALKPGRYTLIGTRLGFQDKRTDLELRPVGDKVQSFTIVCNEQIGDAS